MYSINFYAIDSNVSLEHPNLKTASKALYILNSVYNQIYNIKAYAGQSKLLTLKGHDFALNLSIYKDPEELENNIGLCLEEVQKAINFLNKIEDEKTRERAFTIFISNIHTPNPKRPIEEWFHSALDFAQEFKNTNQLPLSDEPYLDLSQAPLLIKSIRWDKKTYINNFVNGVTKSAENQHHERLRDGKHKEFTVFANGVYSYSQKPNPYKGFTEEN